MKKWLFSLSLLLFVMLPLTGFTMAPARPAVLCTGSPCLQTQDWPTPGGGHVHGGFSVAYIATLAGGGTPSYAWSAFVTMDNGTHDYAIVGYGFGLGNLLGTSNGCSTTLGQYFWTDSDGFFSCYTIPSGDYGNYTEFGVTYYTSGGGGAYYWIHHTKTGDAPCNPCTFALLHNTWTDLQIIDSVDGLTTATGYVQHISHWIFNRWQGSTGSISYQTNSGNGVSSNGAPPPQEFWHKAPASGNSGGDLENCIYGSTSNSCP